MAQTRLIVLMQVVDDQLGRQIGDIWIGGVGGDAEQPPAGGGVEGRLIGIFEVNLDHVVQIDAAIFGKIWVHRDAHQATGVVRVDLFVQIDERTDDDAVLNDFSRPAFSVTNIRLSVAMSKAIGWSRLSAMVSDTKPPVGGGGGV